MLWKIYKKILKILAKQVPVYQLRAFLFRRAGYKIGQQVQITEDLIIIDELKDRGLVSIGDRVGIGPRVTLIVSSRPTDHAQVNFSAHIRRGPICIKNDAWIGAGAIIFPNVTIGEGAIIGAGSIVTRDIPPFCIAVGSPARIMKKLGGSGSEE